MANLFKDGKRGENVCLSPFLLPAAISSPAYLPPKTLLILCLHSQRPSSAFGDSRQRGV